MKQEKIDDIRNAFSAAQILDKISDSRYSIPMPFNWDMLYAAMEEYAQQLQLNKQVGAGVWIKDLLYEAYTDATGIYKNIKVYDWWQEFELRHDLKFKTNSNPFCIDEVKDLVQRYNNKEISIGKLTELFNEILDETARSTISFSEEQIEKMAEKAYPINSFEKFIGTYSEYINFKSEQEESRIIYIKGAKAILAAHQQKSVGVDNWISAATKTS